MKKIISNIAGIILGGILIYSCQEEVLNVNQHDTHDNIFKSNVEAFDINTKTVIGPGNILVWSENDAIAIFKGKSNGDKYIITAESEGKSNAEFQKAEGHNDNVSSEDKFSHNIAIYPYAEGLSCHSDTQTAGAYNISNIFIPSTQQYSENSFGNETFPMVAITEDITDATLNFKNIFGAIKLKLVGTDIVTSIRIEGKNNEILCGKATATTYTDATPTISLLDNSATSVTLNCEDGVQLSSNTSTAFYIALPPTDFSKGFIVTITDSKGEEKVIETDKRNEIKRSSILVMPEIVNGEIKRTELNTNGESANCYIVSEPGVYTFKARKGNSQEILHNINNVEVLWESFGNYTIPETGDLIRTVTHSGENIIFSTQLTLSEGNAVIAAKDENGRILWSWHIWFVEDTILNHYLSDNTGVMMDRNLGATTRDYNDKDPYDVGYYGLLYQWGRKDPFLCAGSDYNGSSPAATTATWPESVRSEQATGNVAYATENPMRFIYCTNNSGDWIFGGDYNPDSPLWSSEKTQYDPCPIGWRVPPGGALSKVGSSSYSEAYSGVTFSHNSFKIYYPEAGYYSFGTSDFNGGSYGWYWTTSTYGYDSKCMQIYNGNSIKTELPYYRASGFSIRCYRDTKDGESKNAIQDIRFDIEKLELALGTSYKLTATYFPENALDNELTWTSDNKDIASVDSQGNVTSHAEGQTVITCAAQSGVTRHITVTVLQPLPTPRYIDGNGIDHGAGIRLNGVVWAPVNCGYHADTTPDGHIYQWGMKSGHHPINMNKANGPTSLYYGVRNSHFYKVSSSPYNWCSEQIDDLWNSGNEEEPVKTAYDPCPTGWRVPTSAELSSLQSNVLETDEGCYFSGEYPNTEQFTRLFLPYTTYVDYSGRSYSSNDYGWYWSSSSQGAKATALKFYSNKIEMIASARGYGYSIRCVATDSEPTIIPTLGVEFKGNIEMFEGQEKSANFTTVPQYANGPVIWSSSAPDIADVDENGIITGVSAGVAKITAEGEKHTSTCLVTIYKGSNATADYIDEYNINHGKGIKIDGAVWAPVNCGYHETDYPYGKLYQWGRKYGQGYDPNDASTPELVEKQVTSDEGQSNENANIFFYSSSYKDDWCSPADKELWNSGSKENPIKTANDPCPEGWRVPTYYEINDLAKNYSSWNEDEYDRNGLWFSGSYEYTSDAPQIFLPAAGTRSHEGKARDRGTGARYWSSLPWDASYGRQIYYNNYYGDISVSVRNDDRILGGSVRCVQE